MALTEKTLMLDGLQVNYWEDGQEQARSLLLIHGGIGDAAFHWKPVMPILAETFHVYAPDLPGFGKSALLRQMSTDGLLKWLNGFMQALGIEQTVVVGNSFGALVARLLAAANPQAVPAVVLVNGGAVPSVPPVFSVLARVPLVSQLFFAQFGRMGTSSATLKRMIHAPEVLTEAFTNEVRAASGGFTRLMKMLFASPMPQKQTPLVPTLILWGANDQLTSVADAEAIKASIPGSLLTTIAECGHMPQLETPDVFVWQVNTFLDNLSRPRQPSRSGGPTILSSPPS
jgi:pimeloyl-ACP methyl ester carboxylesterase